MKFKYRKLIRQQIRGKKDSKSFPRPIIPVKIINGSQEAKVYALIDSGSDYCIFQGSLGQEIGLDIKNGREEEIIGIKNQPIKIYFHNIKLGVGGHIFSCSAAFSSELDNLPLAILGQQGFFSKYIVTLDFQKERIELKERGKNTKK